jgi:exodeoxyribonuclease VIII
MTSNADYHADPAISASHLKAVMQSPYHYWRRFLDPKRPPMEPTSAMRLGSLAHCAVLEPDELSNRYSICLPRNTKAGKEQAAELAAAGIEAVTESDMVLAFNMADAVRQHPYAAALLADGKAEQSFWWDDKATGQRCKCRPDWYQGTTIVDLKTCQDASPGAFARACATFGYHTQAAHYLNGTFAERFIFIAVEKTYPYAVGVYELDAAAMAAGAKQCRIGLQTIGDCRAINEWPGYTTTCDTIAMPNWALYGTTTITSDDF